MDDHHSSWAPLLQQMSGCATEDLTAGLRQIARVFQTTHGSAAQWGPAVRQALEQMAQTYLAFATEVRALATLQEATLDDVFGRFARVRLVTRIHQGRGDAVAIRRLSQTLQIAASSDALEVAAVLERWANREVHLFGWLVPFALYVEHLMSSLAREPTLDGRARQLYLVRLHLRPIWRALALTIQKMQQLAREVEAGSVAMPAPLSTEPETTGWKTRRVASYQ